MNKKIQIIVSVAFVAATMALPVRLWAQEEETVSAEASASGEVQVSTAVETEESVSPTSSGETEKQVSGRWGLFFLGIKERVSLLTTFDPVKKAEKALKFAEERTRIAETLAEKTDDPKAQERIEKVLKRAELLEEKAGEIKDRLLENPDERAKLLLKNMLNFKERKEEVFSKIEEKISPEHLERLQALREQSQEKSKALMNALENTNIPEEVREHLEETKTRIEEHRAEVEVFHTEQKELLDRVKSGDESAKEELKTLREERATEIKADVDARVETRNTTSTRPATKHIIRKEIREEIKENEMRPQITPEQRIKREAEMQKKREVRQETQTQE